MASLWLALRLTVRANAWGPVLRRRGLRAEKAMRAARSPTALGAAPTARRCIQIQLRAVILVVFTPSRPLGSHALLLECLPMPKLNFMAKSDRDFVVACYDGNVDAVTFMLKSGQFDGNTSTSGQSALCAAAAGVRGGRPQSDEIKVRLIRLLCAHGADPNRFNWRKWSPLHYAILNGSAVVATELLDQGADVDALFDGATPLVLVACEDPRYPTTVSNGGPAVVVAHQRSSALTPAAKRTLMRLLPRSRRVAAR